MDPSSLPRNRHTQRLSAPSISSQASFRTAKTAFSSVVSSYQTASTSLTALLENARTLRGQPLDLSRALGVKDLANMTKIGEGGFADVFLFHDGYFGEVAIKHIRGGGGEAEVTRLRALARKEARVWHLADHPNILRFLGTYNRGGQFFLVSAYAPNGTIVTYTKENPERKLVLLAEAAKGLAFLHSMEIVHGDIKGSNVLVSLTGHSLICDFGLTKPTGTATTHLQGAGSTRWMSPEVLKGEPRTPSSDMWSFGMMIAEVLSGRVPFSEMNIATQIILAIVNKKARPPREPTSSPKGRSYGNAWECAEECWVEASATRPSAKNIHDRISRCAVLRGHHSPVVCVTFSPDSRTLASVSWDKTIRLRDVAQAIPLGEPLKKHTDDVNSVAFSPDGTTLVSGSNDGTLRLWDVSTGRTVGEPLTGHTNWVRSVTLSPDGRYIASASDDKTIRIWDSVSRRCIAVLEGHTEVVTSVAFSPDGKMLVSGSGDCSVRRWDMATYAQIGEPMKGHTVWVRSVAVSPDSSTIASGSDDMTICLWDARSGEPKRSPLGRHTSVVLSVAFHPNGRFLASGSFDDTIRIWDLTTAPPTTKLELNDHTDAVWSVAFSPDGKWLASGSGDRTVRLWDLEVLIGTA